MEKARPPKRRTVIWMAAPCDGVGVDLLALIMRRYERASTRLTSNRPVDEWGKLLGDTAAVTALPALRWRAEGVRSLPPVTPALHSGAEDSRAAERQLPSGRRHPWAT